LKGKLKNVKRIVISLSLMLLLISTSLGRPASAQAPEATVRGFYTWYLHRLNLNDSNPLKNRTEALKYLTPEFLKKVPHLTRAADADVIICAQDWDKGWEKNVQADAAVVEGSRATTVVHLKGGEMSVNVKVMLKHTTAGWRIDGTTCVEQ